MSRYSCWPVVAASGVAAAVASPVWAQAPAQGYTYVKMSLTVPWTLYFVFLACVLIPFVVMIVLAWRGSSKRDLAPRVAADDESAPGAS